MNKYEEGIIRRILKREGFVPCSKPEEAQVSIVLTCMVREHAEKRALGFINSKGRGIRVIAGCMAEGRREELEKYADIVVGPDRYRELPSFIRESILKKEFLLKVGTDGEVYEDIFPDTDSSVSSYITVMRGCNNFCSYCIVPYVRGRERSRSVDSILDEVARLAEKGRRYFILIGQNVLAYGDKGTSFSKLLNMVTEIEGVERVSFLTSHPKDVSDEFIDTVAKNSKIVKYFHLPLQSGSDRILNLMNRKYTVAQYLEIINKIRERMPEAVITTDMIVGFPTETEEDYRDTLSIMEKIEFDFAYMFKYSERPFTSASRMKPKVDEETKRRRLKEIISLQTSITHKKLQQELGKVYDILIEDSGSVSMGRTMNNRQVYVERRLAPGKFYRVKISKKTGWKLYGDVFN